MIDKLIIGLTGYKNSGKDKVAQLLLNNISIKEFTHSYRFGFADFLKKELAELFDTTVDHINERKSAGDVTMRRVLQWYGTDYKRKEFGDNVWISKMSAAIAMVPTSSVIVIPDVRFPNEAAWIKSLAGSVMLKVEREGQCNDDLHPSEQGVLQIQPDFYVSNNGKTIPMLNWECKCVKRQIWDLLKL